MKTLKKAISVVSVLSMLFATVAVASSVSASAEDAKDAPVYFTKFTQSNFEKFVPFESNEDRYEKAKKGDQKAAVTYNADGSITATELDIDGKNAEAKGKGVRLQFKLDQSAYAYEAQLKKEADEAYKAAVEKEKRICKKNNKEYNEKSVSKVYPSVSINCYINDMGDSKTDKYGPSSDTFLRFWWVLKDGTKVTPFGPTYAGGRMYATKNIKVSLSKQTFDKDGKAVGESEAISLSDVSGMIVEFSHYNESYKTVTFSSPTVSGVGEIPELAPLNVNEKDTTAMEWNVSYRTDYEPSPKGGVFYNTTFDASNPQELYSKEHKDKKGRKTPGYMGWSCDYAGQQYQTRFLVDKDKFDNALAIANKKDEKGNLIGSGKMKFTIYMLSCVDSNNKPVKAQVRFMVESASRGYFVPEGNTFWIEPGEVKEIQIDVSDFKRGDIDAFIPAVQNYWYYDDNGNLVQYPKDGADIENNTDAEGDPISSKAYGTGVKKCPIQPKVVFSPISVVPANYVPTTAGTIVDKTTKPATTKPNKTSNEGSGYHAFNYDNDLRILNYGNAAEKYIYFNDKSKATEAAPSDNGYFDGGVKLRSVWNPKKANKQFQGCWTLTESFDDDNGNAVKINPTARKAALNRLRQGFAYAKANGLNMLAYKVRVNMAKRPYDVTKTNVGRPAKEKEKQETSAECGVSFGLTDPDMDDVYTKDYIGVGGVKTLYLDVSEINKASDPLTKVDCVRPTAMNYAICDPVTKAACGMTDIDVDFSAIYVVGTDDAEAVKRVDAKKEKKADMSEVNAIVALYKQLPGLNASDYNTPEDWELLEKFLTAVSNASAQTIVELEKKGITTEIIGKLQDIYINGGEEDNPAMGADAFAPVAVVLTAVAAGFVIAKARRREDNED